MGLSPSTDIYSEARRSEIMSHVRGRGNRVTEIALAKILRKYGITGWRRHLPFPGRPDFAFPLLRLAIFVDGCFWHMCPFHSSMPVRNRSFWEGKLTMNVIRDRRARRRLRAAGWKVIRIWQHELRPTNQRRCVRRIQAAIASRHRVHVTLEQFR